MTPAEALARENAELRQTVEALEYEVAFLRRERSLAASEGVRVRLQKRFGVTPQQADLLFSLSRVYPRALTALDLDEALDRLDLERSLKSITVQVCNIRRKAGRSAIETVSGRGYRIGAEALAQIKSIEEGAQ